jgi:hypothetical protein
MVSKALRLMPQNGKAAVLSAHRAAPSDRLNLTFTRL